MLVIRGKFIHKCLSLGQQRFTNGASMEADHGSPDHHSTFIFLSPNRDSRIVNSRIYFLTVTNCNFSEFKYWSNLSSISEATFKSGQKSQIVRCRTCLKRLIVRQSAAKIVKLCGEIAANIH